MRKLITFFIKYPIWANAIILVTTIAGLISMFTMQHSFFPELEPNRVFVTVAYPGASPSEIEEGITSKIEEKLEGLEGIKETTSKSQENVCSITVHGHEGVDLNELLAEIKNAVDGVNGLPAGAERPMVVAQKSRGMGGMGGVVGFLSLNGPDNLEDLKKMAQKVEQDFLASPAISQVEIFGYPPQIISIEINEKALLKYGITFDAVAAIIRASNTDMSAGSVKTNSEELYIRALNKSADPVKFQNIVVRALPDGQLIKLKEIANVQLKFADIALKNYVNGKRSVTIMLKKLPNEDISSIAKFTHAYMEKFNKEDNGFEILNQFMFSDMLDQRIEMLSQNLFFGLLLVCIVLGFFLSIRLSAWVAFGIPFSFIGMFFFGMLYGMSINMISLFGMILVVGILVDDGIVIAENIYAHYERGKSALRAAIDGTMEVVSAVFTSVLTTIVAFGFLLFVGGEMAMMEEMAFSVVACLAFSLIEAFLILPTHLASKKILAPSSLSGYNSIRGKINRWIESIKNIYETLLRRLMKRYRWYVFVPLLSIFIILGLLTTGVIKMAFYMNPPFNDIGIEISYKPGDRETKTENFLWYLDSIVADYDRHLTDSLGQSVIKYRSINLGSTERMGESGNHAGMIRISVEEQNLISTFDISNQIKRRIHPDSIKSLEKFAIGGDSPFGSDIAISLQSEDNKQLRAATKWLSNGILELPEVKDLIDNSGIGNREIHLDLKPTAYHLGLNESMIISQIRQGFFGMEVQRLIIGRDEVKVWLQYPDSDKNEMGDLDMMRIKTTNGQEFLLSELADYTIKRGRTSINHINGKQEIRIYGSLYNSDLSADVNRKITADFLDNLNHKFPEVEYVVKGQAEKAADSIKRLAISFVLAILLIMIILSLNFKSFYQARIIMMVIPVGIFSAILGHGVYGIPFSMLSFMGIIALVGILVNDAVVMLDTYNRNLKEGLNPLEAIILAGKARFRPIILTSITTVVGLWPLMNETSFQAQFLIPMAVSVAFGVLFGTLVLLLFFPALILYFNDIRRARFWLWRGGATAPERIQVEPVTKIMHREMEMTNSELENH